MATRTKKVKPAKKAAPRSTPVARSGPVAPSEGSEADRLRDLKLQLQAAQDKLLLIDPNKLDDDAHAAWSNQIFQLSRAINKLRNVLLEQLSAEFAAELPAIESATGKLADELQRLKNAVDVINAVAGILGVVTRIITLLG